MTDEQQAEVTDAVAHVEQESEGVQLRVVPVVSVEGAPVGMPPDDVALGVEVVPVQGARGAADGGDLLAASYLGEGAA